MSPIRLFLVKKVSVVYKKIFKILACSINKTFLMGARTKQSMKNEV